MAYKPNSTGKKENRIQENKSSRTYERARRMDHGAETSGRFSGKYDGKAGFTSRPGQKNYRKQFNGRDHFNERTDSASSLRRESGSGEALSEARSEALHYHEYEFRPAAAEARRDPEPENILCGRNPIREALRGGREIEKILVQKGDLNASAREIIQAARDRKIMVQAVDRRRLDEIYPHHQGLIAIAAAYAYSEVSDMLDAAAAKGEDPFLVLLDGITDPHNLGAIIRTAVCAGAHGVIIPQHRSVGLTPAAVKASAGAVEHIRVAKVVNLNKTIDDLKRRGLWIYAMTMDGKDYEKVSFHGGTALVVGSEGEGVSRLTAEKCDLCVSLPMIGPMDSLNASVAAGVMMYRVMSDRRKG